MLYYRYEEEEGPDPKAPQLDRSLRAFSSRWSDEEPQEGSEQEGMPGKGASMKVGDLVKVYNFSRRARRRWPETSLPNGYGYTVGLIVGDCDAVCIGGETGYREVLRCIDTQKKIYKTDRLEVINESR